MFTVFTENESQCSINNTIFSFEEALISVSLPKAPRPQYRGPHFCTYSPVTYITPFNSIIYFITPFLIINALWLLSLFCQSGMLDGMYKRTCQILTYFSVSIYTSLPGTWACFCVFRCSHKANSSSFPVCLIFACSSRDLRQVQQTR